LHLFTVDDWREIAVRQVAVTGSGWKSHDMFLIDKCMAYTKIRSLKFYRAIVI
jgi:hypothetical protein